MDQFAARLFKPLAQWEWREKSERSAPAGRPTPPSVLSSATIVSPHRSARVLSLLLTLEALRGAPDVLDSPDRA